MQLFLFFLLLRRLFESAYKNKSTVRRKPYETCTRMNWNTVLVGHPGMVYRWARVTLVEVIAVHQNVQLKTRLVPPPPPPPPAAAAAPPPPPPAAAAAAAATNACCLGVALQKVWKQQHFLTVLIQLRIGVKLVCFVGMHCTCTCLATFVNPSIVLLHRVRFGVPGTRKRGCLSITSTLHNCC